MTRQEKLDKLKAKRQKPQKDLLSAYEKLVSVLDAGIDVNADELINQLEKVAGLENVVNELKTAISEFKIPEVKDSVEIKGLQGLIEAVKAIKAPEAKVSVDFADTKSIKAITDKLGALVKATTDKIYVTNSQPGDFIPVRRVKLVGSKLLFDDDTWGGGMGGGTNTSGLATTAKQDEIVTAIQAIGGSTNYTTRIAENSGDANITYIGNAVIGSAEASAVWQIKRLDATTGLIKLWRDGNDSYDNAWTTREAGSYS